MNVNDPPIASSQEQILLGVDLGSNHIRIGTVELDGKLKAFRHTPYTEEALTDSYALAEQILTTVHQMVDELKSESISTSAIGIAFPCRLNNTNQRILKMPHLPDLHDIDLYREFTKAFDVPIHFENNANAAAYAEMVDGKARGVEDFVYLHIGANVAAGLVIGGKLRRGKSGHAGSIGQMKIDPEASGNPVELESMASAVNIVRRTRARLQRDSTSSLSRLGAMGGFTYDDIIAAAGVGDELALMMIKRTGRFIAITISEIMNLLNPAMILVGGAPAARQPLIDAISEEVSKRVSEIVFNDCQIIPADLGAEAGVIGAALLANNKN